jgi:hypothetical protein
MEFFIAYRSRNGEVNVLPSFHFPTADEARSKIAQLRKVVEIDLQVIRVVYRGDIATLCSAA